MLLLLLLLKNLQSSQVTLCLYENNTYKINDLEEFAMLSH